MEKELSEYLERQLRLAMEGEMPPRWRSPEAEQMSQAVRGLFSEAMTDEARQRVFLRLGLAGLSALVHRSRAAMVAARAEALMRGGTTPNDKQAPQEDQTP